MSGKGKNYDLIIIGAGAAGLTAAVAFLRGGGVCGADGGGVGNAACGIDCGGAGADADADADADGRDLEFDPSAGHGGRVLLIDSCSEPGKKILSTGNGRCNITNRAADGFQATCDFFESLGVLIYTEQSGLAYPKSRQAQTVRDALVGEAKKLGAEFALDMRVLSVGVCGAGDREGFEIACERSGEAGALAGSAKRDKSGVLTARGEPFVFHARQVIVATGGKACPKFGNLGDGFAFARSLGIGVTPVRPALVPFVYADEERVPLARLAGVRARAAVKLVRDGAAPTSGTIEKNEGGIPTPETATEMAPKQVSSSETMTQAEVGMRLESTPSTETVAEAEGEVQFADYGLSGICIFDLSRYFDGAGGYSVHIDFAPEYTKDEIEDLLSANRVAGLSGIINTKIAAYIESVANDPSNSHASEYAAMVKDFIVRVKGTKGWKEAQITAGGVAMDELDALTCESKAVPGLYFAGEVTDYDGASGGYNLDHAWTSGLSAGAAAARR